MLHTIVSDLLWRSLAILLLIGASVGMALALLLIFKPQLLQRIVRLIQLPRQTIGQQFFGDDAGLDQQAADFFDCLNMG